MNYNLDRRLLILILISIIILSFKLSLSLNTEIFTESSYFHLRVADSIKENLSPSINDELSYQGRDYKVTPLFYYLIAFIPLIWIKVLTNILLVSTSIIIYFIVKNLVRDKNIPLYSGIISLFIPAGVILTNSEISPISLFSPLFAFFILSFIKRNVWSSWPLIISIVLLIITSPITIFVVLGLGMFLLLQRIKNLHPAKKDIEILFFFLFLAIWFFAITYKNALLGWNFIWANTPKNILYPNISLANLFSNVGVLPLLLGVIGANKVFDNKNKNQLMILSISIVIILALLFGVLPLISGLTLLGFVCSILSGIALFSIKDFVNQSKFYLNKLIPIILVLIFASTTFIPFIEANINQSLPSEEKLDSLKFLASQNGAVISSPEEANLIMYFSGRKTYYDNYYVFSDAEERYEDATTIFKGNSPFEATIILNEEDINWIYLSPETKRFYGIEDLKIYELSNCLNLEYKGEVKVYENRCKIT